MSGSTKRLLGLVCGIVALTTGAGATFAAVYGAAHRQVLKSNDLTGVRREALTLFPRGSRLQDVTARLIDVGFLCEPMRPSLGDISGPALLCQSNGRGYPFYPAINVTVSTRNGLVSEIEVWNIMARSDSEASLGRTAERAGSATLTATADDAH